MKNDFAIAQPLHRAVAILFARCVVHRFQLNPLRLVSRMCLATPYGLVHNATMAFVWHKLARANILQSCIDLITKLPLGKEKTDFWSASMPSGSIFLAASAASKPQAADAQPLGNCLYLGNRTRRTLPCHKRYTLQEFRRGT